MKEKIKSILKQFNIYHPLQSGYRDLIESINKLYYRIKYLKYRGKGYICNFCWSKYTKFIAEHPSANIADAIYSNNVVAGFGENVYCPNCLSKNRERLVKAVLENLHGVQNKDILHFSPERHLYKYLNEVTNVQTVDILPGFYKNIDKKILYGDATNLQFNDCSFDVIVANHILEHIPDDTRAMREIFRILKFGGFAILQIPYSETLINTIEEPDINDPKKQEQLYGQMDHVRIYSLQNYLLRLKEAGFTIKLLLPEELLPFKMYATQENEIVIMGFK